MMTTSNQLHLWSTWFDGTQRQCVVTYRADLNRENIDEESLREIVDRKPAAVPRLVEE